jgi:hypothetical protein
MSSKRTGSWYTQQVGSDLSSLAKNRVPERPVATIKDNGNRNNLGALWLLNRNDIDFSQLRPEKKIIFFTPNELLSVSGSSAF